MEYGAYFKGTERPINVLMEKVIRKREDADGSIRVIKQALKYESIVGDKYSFIMR